MGGIHCEYELVRNLGGNGSWTILVIFCSTIISWCSSFRCNNNFFSIFKTLLIKLFIFLEFQQPCSWCFSQMKLFSSNQDTELINLVYICIDKIMNNEDFLWIPWKSHQAKSCIILSHGFTIVTSLIWWTTY